MRRYGWKPDPRDHRDRSINELLKRTETYKTEVNLEEFCPDPFDQDGAGSCVGQSGAGALYTAAGIDFGKNNRFIPSAQFLYYIARLMHGAQDVDLGTALRYLFKAVQKYGVSPLEACPYAPFSINAPPTWDAYRKAYDQRWVEGYYRIDSYGDQRIEDMKQALSEGNPICFGMDVGTVFENYTGGIMDDTGPRIGGHAMFLYGYYGNEFWRGQNSWGDWGENGRFRFSLRVALRMRDLWVVKTAPKYSGT